MNKKVRYYIDRYSNFVIENYNIAGAFSNFLPGISGLFGIPMWVFYVNRGQCVCSFGIGTKDGSIMEFLPANRAYQLAPSQSFRTFLKIRKAKQKIFYEPFRSYSGETKANIIQRMFINACELRIEEINSTLGLDTEVIYFTVPNESFPALARVITIRNNLREGISIELLDGAPLVIPYGVSNFFLQKLRRTVEAWMSVENLDKRIPFYKLKTDPKDSSEIKFIEEGHFYVAFSSKNGKGGFLSPIVDPEVVFGKITDFSYPVNFANTEMFKHIKNQMAQNKLPSAMGWTTFELKRGEDIRIYSLFGHMSSKEKLNLFSPRFTKEEFFIDKRKENKILIDEIQQYIFTESADRRYDGYCRQTFLDNVIRGGLPLTISNSGTYVLYIYSRKHGDLERDYNKFLIEPSYFSQGDGNYRDINQNRRNDVFFNPDINDFNIIYFYNLIQADGYNPLILKGIKFKVEDIELISKILKEKITEEGFNKIKPLLLNEFTPGRLFMEMEKYQIPFKDIWYDVLEIFSKNCSVIYDAEHGEGFWIDHWTYNLDLVENFLSIYPERLKEIFLDKKEFTFYDNAFFVKPRSLRYLLKGDVVRQYHSLDHDPKKIYLIRQRKTQPHLMRTKNGEGEIYKTTLLVKMLCIIINKISTLDPFGKGIEMEADKPGWCDAMNGLPGLFGSSVPELFELKRMVDFIIDSLDRINLEDNYSIEMPEELYDFVRNIEGLLRQGLDDFSYWDKSNSFKEEYRDKVRYGFTGVEKSLRYSELKDILKLFDLKLRGSIKKVSISKNGVVPTYFINELTRYEVTEKTDPAKGLPIVRPLEFRSISLPLFLEGPVRALKIEKDKKKARALYRALKKTALYDRKLKMYKINEPLGDVSKEIGRSVVFTPGWLENESIWLHMEYKYLLEILRSGLYEEFFEEFKTILVPFLRPNVYGRSIFENSSFIVSSAFPDPKLHGRGFVARLSGSTAEMLNIWILMNVGEQPFFVNEKGQLNLRFRPALPSWLFKKGKYTFMFLGKVPVTYYNPERKNTAGKGSVKVSSISIEYPDARRIDIKGNIIPWPYSKDIRDRSVNRIDIYLK